MYYFLVFVVTATIIASAQTQNGKLEEGHTHQEQFKIQEIECAKEKNITLDVLAEAKTGHFPIIDNKLNCYAECLFNKLSFLENDKIRAEAIISAAKAKGGEKSSNIAQRCIAKAFGVDTCDTTYQIFRCFFEETNKLEVPKTVSTTVKPLTTTQKKSDDNNSMPTPTTAA